MTHLTFKEVAEEIYIDFYENLWYVDEKDRTLNAKQCSIITVNRLLEHCHHLNKWYWEEIKNANIMQELRVQKLLDKDIFDQATLAMEEDYGSGCTEEIDAYFRGAKWMQNQLKQ